MESQWEEAIQAAIDHCIERDILTDILQSEKSEVLHMIFLTEYDEKKHLRHTFEEGREEGIKEGVAKGSEDKLLEQIRKKHSKGKSVEAIAEELEEEVETVQALLQRIQH